MSQLKKGAILSYITIFLTTTIGLVLTPFIIKSLGDAEYFKELTIYKYNILVTGTNDQLSSEIRDPEDFFSNFNFFFTDR